MELDQMIKQAASALSDKKALDVRALKVDKLTSITEAFVIASAASASQLVAMADAAEEGLEKAGANLRRREGTPASGWVLLDFGSLMVHLFHQEKRQFYQLERLWADAEQVALPKECDNEHI